MANGIVTLRYGKKADVDEMAAKPYEVVVGYKQELPTDNESEYKMYVGTDDGAKGIVMDEEIKTSIFDKIISSSVDIEDVNIPIGVSCISTENGVAIDAALNYDSNCFVVESSSLALKKIFNPAPQNIFYNKFKVDQYGRITAFTIAPTNTNAITLGDTVETGKNLAHVLSYENHKATTTNVNGNFPVAPVTSITANILNATIGASDITITLPTDATVNNGRQIKIYCTSTEGTPTNKVIVKVGTADIDFIYHGMVKTYEFSNSKWTLVATESFGPNAQLGYLSKAYDKGTSVGCSAQAFNSSVAVGHSSKASAYGVSVGTSSQSNGGIAIGTSALALGGNNGVAVGNSADTNSKINAIAKGYASKCNRDYEEWRSTYSSGGTNKAGYSQAAWYKETSGPITNLEIFLGGSNDKRYKLYYSATEGSAMSANIEIIAKSNLGTVKSWRLEATLSIDANGLNAKIVDSWIKNVMAEDANAEGWDVNISADESNNALVLKVTGGIAGEIIRWHATLQPTSEVRI